MPFSLRSILKRNHGSGSSDAVNGGIVMGYFTNWSIYDRNYKPHDVPVENLTHILYAFANINPDDGTVFLSDAWADEQIRHDGQEVPGNALYGNLGQFLALKRRNRHLKLLLSIGGWSYSSNFSAVRDPSRRARFVESAVNLLKNYGLDGLDIDWEYPESPQDAQVYLELLRDLRRGIDEYAERVKQAPFLLTIAAPCVPSKIDVLRVREMDEVLDLWNLMAYDFSGSWDQCANHQANLHGGSISVDAAVSSFRSKGASPAKLVLGLPLYGRGFDGAKGPGSPYGGVSPGEQEGGVYSYRSLPHQGSSEEYDSRACAGFSYDPAHGRFITYESPASAKGKCDYVKHKGLAGVMFWELSGDAQGERSLVELSAKALRPLDSTENHVDYPESSFDNARK
ncbi:chitinase [Malassezia cuniculi]|uniref:chitinase n=1 Tax=Malassezia cuniculi TaxID=948313 RepID=A0AAF0J6K7_9BASI|nr:chitinase [Malassezia cuniculi]